MGTYRGREAYNVLIDEPWDQEDKFANLANKEQREKTYDEFTADLARYPSTQTDGKIVSAMYCALGLVGEAGEVSEKIKKWHRDGKIDKEAVALELGDVLYYLTRLANEMGFTLKDVERMNRAKLTKRKENNTIHGSGDNR
jgi:NTP pyrophosphatase (non-canonical NTP hydrolase)